MFTPKDLKLIEMFRRASVQNQTSTEVMIVAALDMAGSKLYRKFGRISLVQMFIEDFRTDHDASHTLDRVVRAALAYPDLERALREKAITVGKATRILGSLEPENVKELVAFASAHTIAEINAFIAEKAPPGKYRESSKQVSADQYRVVTILTAQQFKRLQRVRSLEAQKGKSAKIGDALSAATALYLWRNDPVEKAARANVRNKWSAHANKKPTPRAARTPAEPATKAPVAPPAEIQIVRTSEAPVVSNQSGRIPLTMADRHAVTLKTGGRCTFVDERGKRCTQDIWIDVHHVIPISEGGTNHISNLTHLCGPHHDLVHQLCLPLDEQVPWWHAGTTPTGRLQNEKPPTSIEH